MNTLGGVKRKCWGREGHGGKCVGVHKSNVTGEGLFAVKKFSKGETINLNCIKLQLDFLKDDGP